MKKQEYKFILGNGSDGEVIASSLSDALSNLSLGDKLKMQKRIMEEQDRSKKMKIDHATPQPITTNTPEAFKPTAEQVAEFEKIMQRRAELDKKIKELEEEIKNDLEKKQTLAEVSPATAGLMQLLGEDNVVASMNAVEETEKPENQTNFSMKPYFPEGEWSSTPEKTEHLSEKGVLFKIGDSVKYDGESMGRITGFDDKFAFLEKNNNSQDKRATNINVLEKE